MWEALNDPAVLARCIPGCESLERTGPDALEAKVRARVGPVSASFAGTVTLSEVVPPTSYVISGEGKGGAAGFARGSARVTLEDEEGGGTALSYAIDASVGGKLAQLGARLISGTVEKYADGFFAALAESLAEPSAAPAAPEPPAPAPEAPAAPAIPWARILVLVLVGALIALGAIALS